MIAYQQPFECCLPDMLDVLIADLFHKQVFRQSGLA